MIEFPRITLREGTVVGLRAGLIALVFVVALSGCTFVAEEPVTPEVEESVTTGAEEQSLSLRQAVQEFESTDLDTFASENCSILSDLDYEMADADLTKLEKLRDIRDSRAAAELMKSQEVPPQEYLTYWLSAYDQSLNRIIRGLLDKAEGSYSAYKSWTQDLENAIITNCELGNQFSETKQALQSLGNEAGRVRRLAASVPWYPEGYQAFSTNVAYKWNDSRGCDYWGCWNIDVITQTSCSNLYVEMNIFDNSGAIVGFTNDSARNVRAGEVVKMRLDDIYDGSSGRITEMNCS